jgi:hypothetical protein
MVLLAGLSTGMWPAAEEGEQYSFYVTVEMKTQKKVVSMKFLSASFVSETNFGRRKCVDCRIALSGQISIDIGFQKKVPAKDGCHHIFFSTRHVQHAEMIF